MYVWIHLCSYDEDVERLRSNEYAVMLSLAISRKVSGI